MTMLQLIDVHQLKTLRDNKDKNTFKLIDVREQHEWDTVRIPDTIHLPKNEVPHKIQAVTNDFSTPIYIHCHAGVRSAQAGLALLELGYEKVYSVEGGISAWIAAGYEVEPVI